MIKRYLQYINESLDSDLFKDLEKIPTLETIEDDVLINFMENNNLKLVSKENGVNIPYINDAKIIKVKKSNLIFKHIFPFDEKSHTIECDYEYSYGYRLFFTKNDKDFILTKNNIVYIDKIINNFYHNLRFVSGIKQNTNNYFIIGPPITFTDKDILNYYDIKDYKQDAEGCYIKLSFDDLADIALEKKSSYKKFFTSTDSIWDLYYRNKDDYDDINDLNKENIEKLNILEDEEIISDIKDVIIDYKINAQVEINLEELWTEFLYQLNEKQELKVKLVKGKNHPYILDDNTKDNSFFKIYFVDKFIHSMNLDEINGSSLLDIIYSYFYDYVNIPLAPNFSDYGNVDYNELNKEVLHILNKL